MVAISLDIGTTKICAIAVDCDTGDVLEVLSEANAFIPAGRAWEKIQDPGRIMEISEMLCGTLIRKYAPIACIGLTGQMHGILYLNRSGEAISPLYTWQDQCGNQPYMGHLSYAEYLTENSAYRMATGFGLTTCFYHTQTGQLPPEAYKLCTIQDYVAMRLVGKAEPIMHPSNAASLGLFDLPGRDFDRKTINRFGMNADLLPAVVPDHRIIGETREGIPVCVAIGDNQASFLGSAGVDRGTILINIGTGSQVSVLYDGTQAPENSQLEVRPYLEGMNMLVGSPLCGGSAYALLERFFREVIRMAGIEAESAYPYMNALLARKEQVTDPLLVSTRFSGTRHNPHERGRIENIGLDNFTPLSMMIGFLNGIAQELYDLAMPILTGAGFSTRHLVAAGNGVRKNPAMRSILSERFGLPVKVPLHREEAAFGAALFAMVNAGVFADPDEAGRLIRYV
ncbi:sedoheptulokinase [Thermoclostridium caenicola]|uniref:Sedoheptulokinase n=1 Tax=Thermoclostridium caenicola TaxID=659425 RepID=A0A1M6AKX5_9FIRM|nr:FGGY family carbohydrate kinase [Thermoclostridium caenicola]SHI37105.1 sedoheptulokinase [Thermoclostridium caenicola]